VIWVKVCCNTTLEDATLAASLGVDALGFVFAPSKRHVTPAQVATITAHLPTDIERVGVFHSANPEHIAHTTATAGLTTAQLHGAFSEDLPESLRKLAPSLQLIQTVHWNLAQPDAAATLAAQLNRIAALGAVDRVLIDSKLGTATGGTGIAFDWASARDVFASAPGSLHLIVAGGLTPANVAQAIARLAPWGVDICSGVESLPGRKDPTLLADFIANARGVKTP
jgi:phosphoribosylanthranilate isomerase